MVNPKNDVKYNLEDESLPVLKIGNGDIVMYNRTDADEENVQLNQEMIRRRNRSRWLFRIAIVVMVVGVLLLFGEFLFFTFR